MRLPFALLSLATLGLCAPLNGQITTDSLTRRHLAGGLSLALPAAWTPLNDSTQAKLSRIMDTVLLNSRDTLLQASLRNGKPIVLLQEAVPGRRTPAASFNAAPSPGMTLNVFASATPAQVADALAPLCGVMSEVAGRMGARVLSCDPAQVDRAASRTIAITRLVRSSPEGFVTVWIVQFPDEDVVYTLTLSALQAEAPRYEPLFRSIWRSVEIPER